MPALHLRFPGGRFHATPWGHHVNEGQVEWPPSPWRLLRALVACGFTTQRWTAVPKTAEQLIEKLAGTLPRYGLPRATVAHSRHYMPVGGLAKGREKTKLVFDTWLDAGSESVTISWNCELTEEESGLLRILAEHLGYLGRSESWVEATVLADDAVAKCDWNAVPDTDGRLRGPGWEQVALLAPIPPDDYAAWWQAATEEALKPFPLPEGKKKPTAATQKARVKAVEPYPATLADCLTKDTAWWKEQRWSQPPGSRQVLYWRRDDLIQVGAPIQARTPEVRRVEAMLLALTTASGNRSALPARSRTLPQAELFHQALVSSVGGGARVSCPEITGRDESGLPLQESHRHAHVLPVDLDGDGRLDHVLVHAPMGLGGEAQKAIRGLRRTWTKGAASELQVALAGSGALGTLRKLGEPLSPGVEGLLGPAGGSVCWVSHTPFVPPRFIKARGTNTLEGQIQAELASRGLPRAEEIEVVQGTPAALAMRHFVRRRQRGGVPPPVDAGYAVRLRLAEPVTGPLSLGYAAHYGLGLFVAETGG